MQDQIWSGSLQHTVTRKAKDCVIPFTKFQNRQNNLYLGNKWIKGRESLGKEGWLTVGQEESFGGDGWYYLNGTVVSLGRNMCWLL